MSYNLLNFIDMIAQAFSQLYTFLKDFITANVPGLNVPVYALIGALGVGAMVILLIIRILR